MKQLIQFLLLAGLVGCATPYYPVYVNNEGNYYIAERSTAGPYYGSNSVMFNDIGVYPWWISAYPPHTFAYYSPNFYPHWFSVWYPPGYHPYFGFYGGYYSYWCPPYRLRRIQEPIDQDGIVGSPVLPPIHSASPTPGDPDLWRSMDRAAVNRAFSQRRGIDQKTAPSPHAIPVYSRSSHTYPTASSVSSSPVLGRPSTGASPRPRASSKSSNYRTYHKQ